MILAKRFAFSLLFFLIIFFIAFWGFKNNFPGKLLSRVIQLHITKQTGITFEIKDLELGWRKISSPKILIHLPRWLSGKTERSIIIFEEIESPFSSFFTSGKLIINGKTHGGEIRFSTEAFFQKNIEFSIEGVKLEKIPITDSTPQAFVSGELSFSAKLKNFEALKKQNKWIPDGYIKGKLMNSKINFSGNAIFFEFQLPELNFSEIFFDLQTGTLISINKIELKGSLDGIINGSIKPNINRPKMSLVDLNLELIPSSIILEKFKSFTPMLLPIQCGDKINVNIKGYLNRINFPTKNKC